MPRIEAHLAAVEENLAAYKAMPEAHPGWRAVMLFYAAVHLVEADCALSNRHHHEHVEREQYIRATYGKTFWQHYSRLKNEAQKARYLVLDPFHRSAAFVGKTMFSLTAEQVHNQLYLMAYCPLRDFLKARIATVQSSAAKAKD